jgi:hypothetical protein
MSSADSGVYRWAIVLLVFSLCTLTSLEANAQILWGDSAKYDDAGVDPTVATNNAGTVVEVHNGGAGVGPLWYRVGQKSGSTIQLGDSAKYDNAGLNPSVGMNDDGTVVEVHNGGAGVGPLWYRVGRLSGSTIQWGDSAQYDNSGRDPTVAINSVGTVVEVHNGGAGVGPLWYRVGRLSGSTIQWGDSAQYDNAGLKPAVAINGTNIVEVHNGGRGGPTRAGPLWYRVGGTSDGFAPPRRPNSWTCATTTSTSPSVHPRLPLVSLALHLPACRLEMTTKPRQSRRNGWLANNELGQFSLLIQPA